MPAAVAAGGIVILSIATAFWPKSISDCVSLLHTITMAREAPILRIGGWSAEDSKR